MSFLLKTEGFSPENLSLEETLFHCANGYVGIRGNIDEGAPEGSSSIRGTYINGFFDTHPINHPEKLFGFPVIGERMLNVTDVQQLDLIVNGETVRPDPERISGWRRELDMRRGICSRSYSWKGSSGRRLDVETRRLASFHHTEYIAMEYRLTALDDLTLDLTSRLNGRVENFSDPDDPRVSGEGFRSLEVEKASIDRGILEMVSRTKGTGLRLQVKSRHRLHRGSGKTPAAGTVDPAAIDGRERIGLNWSIELEAGETVILEKISRFRDSRRYGDGFETAGSRADSLLFDGFAALQQEYLDRFWEDADVVIEGDEHILAGLRYSLYGLLQSGSKDAAAGIPAKGLSGEGYEGHYFWDTEIYMFPFFLHTSPELALRLLEFRCETLPAARQQARNLGHRKGAAYPWRTIAGRECSAYYPSGSAQYHINADIAHSIRQYVDATGDTGFLRDKGAEVLFETARIWMELGNFASDGRFHIHGITGPDEYTCLVSDNYFTNRMAGENLSYAVEVHEQLSGEFRRDVDSDEAREWRRAADRMFLPFDESLGINPQDATFLSKPEWDFEARRPAGPLLLHYHHMTLSRYQVCKQADTILAYMLLGGEDPEVMRRSYDYYEKRTTHDSSLSYAAFAIMAARLGDAEKALGYFRENASLDLDNSHGNTRDGIHAANMGGAWATVVQGFGGFFADGGQPSFSPILPPSWKSLTYRIRWRKASITVTAAHDTVSLTLNGGPETEVEVYGKRLVLKDTLSAAVPG